MLSNQPGGLKRAWAAVWRIAVFFSAWATLIAPVFVLGSDRIEAWEQAHSLWAKLYPETACLLSLLLITWLMTRFADRLAFGTVGLSGTHALRNFVIGLGLGTLWLMIPLFIAWCAGWVTRQSSDPVSLLYMGGAGLALLLNIVTQQLLLCGYVWQTIQARFGFRPAWIISVILFSAYHAGAFHGPWLPAVNVMAAGTVFGLCYRLSGSLWLPIGCHFAWNYLLGLGFGLTVSGTQHYSSGWSSFSVTPNQFTGGSFGFEGGLLVCATTVLLALGLAGFLHRATTRNRATAATPERKEVKT